jgi:transcriptional regulator GlxA family with amidase domain
MAQTALLPASHGAIRAGPGQSERVACVGAGLARGRRVTTHHHFLEQLRAIGGVEVVEGVRFVRDGNLVTAGGVMSGIEMSLWLVGQLHHADVVQRTKSYIAYEYPPRDRCEAS